MRTLAIAVVGLVTVTGCADSTTLGSDNEQVYYRNIVKKTADGQLTQTMVPIDAAGRVIADHSVVVLDENGDILKTISPAPETGLIPQTIVADSTCSNDWEFFDQTSFAGDAVCLTGNAYDQASLGNFCRIYGSRGRCSAWWTASVRSLRSNGPSGPGTYLELGYASTNTWCSIEYGPSNAGPLSSCETGATDMYLTVN